MNCKQFLNKNKYMHSNSKFLSYVVLGGLILATVPFASRVEAAGVAVTVTPSTQTVATAGTTTVSFTTTATLPIGSTIILNYDSTYTGTLSTANTTVNAVAPTILTNATASGRTTSTITTASAVTSGSAVTIATTALTSPVSAGNFSFAISTSVGDAGANLQYSGQANVVLVRALVTPTLSFVIRNIGDTANTNLCDMGTLSTTAVGTCGYRLKVGTNATNGYTVNLTTSGNFTTGTASLTNAAVGTAGTGGTAITAGTPGYGAVITKGSATSAAATTLASVYNAGATNSVSYVNTSSATLITVAGTNNPAASADTTNTSLVTHNAGIASDTAAGLYTQTNTYTIIPSF